MADDCDHEQIVLLSDSHRPFRVHSPIRCEFFAWENWLKIYELSGDGSKGWQERDERVVGERGDPLMVAPFCRRGKTTAAKLFPMCPGASKISSKCAHSSKRPLIRMRARSGKMWS